jgi:NAD(P)H dehydrogenase (quinone)
VLPGTLYFMSHSSPKSQKNKTIVLVSAHPSEQGWVNQMAKYCVEKLEQAGYTCKWIDLYRGPIQPFLGQLDPKTGEACDISGQRELQRLIKQTDELVLLYPLWWGTVPAILKNWMDTNFTPRFAYKYEPTSWRYKVTLLPRGMLGHIRTHQVITCGDHAWKYWWMGSLPTKLINKIFIAFCGMKQGGVKVYGGFGIEKERNNTELPKQTYAWLASQLAR